MHMREQQQGADQPVSVVYDGDRNKVERFEGLDRPVALRVTLSGKGKATEESVMQWYWRSVGTMQEPEYDEVRAGTLEHLSPADVLPDAGPFVDDHGGTEWIPEPV